MTRTRRTPQLKAEAVGLAEVVGVAAAAEQMGIPESSLRRWRERPEMAELRAETKAEVAADVWAGFQKGVQRISVLMETTEDLSKVAIATGILFDKFALMTGEATSRTETRSVTDALDDDERERLRKWIVGLPTPIAAGGPSH